MQELTEEADGHAKAAPGKTRIATRHPTAVLLQARTQALQTRPSVSTGPVQPTRRRCGVPTEARTGDVATRGAASGAPALCLGDHCRCARRWRRFTPAPPELVGLPATPFSASSLRLLTTASDPPPPTVCHCGRGCAGSSNTGRHGCGGATARPAPAPSDCHQPWLRPGGAGGAAGACSGIRHSGYQHRLKAQLSGSGRSKQNRNPALEVTRAPQVPVHTHEV